MGITIENDRLSVEMASPGEYDGTRFDWTGFIRQVTLKDGGHTFCTHESVVPGVGTGGIGLCNEFGNSSPVGYDETANGERFPKLGVGLLARPDDGPYNFFKRLDNRPFEMRAEADGDKASFVVEPLECNGYAARLEKEVALRDGQLIVSYALHNVGTKPIATNEYNHNFVAIDGRPIGPDYELRWGADLQPLSEMSDMTAATLAFDSRGVRFRKPVEGTFYSKFPAFASPAEFYWELVNGQTGAGMRESGSASPIWFALWGTPHVMSPEVFVGVHVAPGETQRWRRAYTFFAGR